MNTLNICIGHLPFPEAHTDFVDLFISPKAVGGGVKRKAIVPDEDFGENGHSLSEYAQLLWLYKNIDKIAPNFEYLNLFHYRRFVSIEPVNGVKSVNAPWINTIQESELGAFASCFNRTHSSSCFNTPLTFSDGIVSQYANMHVLEDFLNFVKYLVEINIFSAMDAVRFIRYQNLIAACSVGIYHVDTFKRLFTLLEQAAGFLHSPHFIPREGYQRRSMGYLLERLHSFLIFEMVGDAARFGHNMMISETPVVTATIDRVNQ